MSLVTDAVRRVRLLLMVNLEVSGSWFHSQRGFKAVPEKVSVPVREGTVTGVSVLG
jgi:hypothetical protein